MLRYSVQAGCANSTSSVSASCVSLAPHFRGALPLCPANTRPPLLRRRAVLANVASTIPWLSELPEPSSAPAALSPSYRASTSAPPTPDDTLGPPKLINRRLQLNPLRTLQAALEERLLLVDLWFARELDSQPLLRWLAPAAQASLAALGGHLYTLLCSGGPPDWLEGLLYPDLLLLAGQGLLWGSSLALAGWHLRTWWAAAVLTFRSPQDPASVTQQPSLLPHMVATWRLVLMSTAAVALAGHGRSVAGLAAGLGAFAASFLPLAVPAVRAALQAVPAGHLVAVATPLCVSDAALLVLLALASQAAAVAASTTISAAAAVAGGTSVPVATGTSALAAAPIVLAAAAFTISFGALTSTYAFIARLLPWIVSVHDRVAIHLTLRINGPDGPVVDTTHGHQPLRLQIADPATEEDSVTMQGSTSAAAARQEDRAAATATAQSTASTSTAVSLGMTELSSIVVTPAVPGPMGAADTILRGAESGTTSSSNNVSSTSSSAARSTTAGQRKNNASVSGGGSSSAGLSAAAAAHEDLKMQHGGRFTIMRELLNMLLLGSTLGESINYTITNPPDGYRNPNLHWWQPRESFETKFRKAPQMPQAGDVFMYPLTSSHRGTRATTTAVLSPVRVVAVGETFIELDGNIGLQGRPLRLEIEVVDVSKPNA